MSIKRTSRRHTSGISQEVGESYWLFKPGQRVMTSDGIPGTVTEVQDGPFAGNEQYLVTLDNDLGGGEYDSSDLSEMPATTAAVIQPGQRVLQTEAVGDEVVTAASDYPELAEILVQRPPLAHSEPLVMRASLEKEAGSWWGDDPSDDYDQSQSEDPIKAWVCAFCGTRNQEWSSVCRSCDKCEMCGQVVPSTPGAGRDHQKVCPQTIKQYGSKTAAAYYLDTPESNALYEVAGNVMGAASRAMAVVEVPDSSIEDGTAHALALAEAAKTDWAALHAYFVCPECKFAGNVDPVTDIATGKKIDICPSCGTQYDYEEIDADGWGLDDPMRPENLTRAASADKKMSPEQAAEEHVFFATAGLWDKVLTHGTDFLNNQMDPQYQVKPGTSYSYDWCRFRKNERCMFPKVLDAEGTKEAGYAVWTPEDRGLCPRNRWEDQKTCPVGEPGPHSGDPHARVDATVPWSEGGQRPFEPGGHLAHRFANLTTEAGFEVTASWADVRAKAKRIRSEGGVRIISAPREGDDSLTVTAEINGDQNVYETTLLREPGRHNVASWRCGCAWASYSWGRQGRYQRFEGRMCSHALALQYEAQSRGMFGKTIVEDAKTPPWRVGNDPFHYEKPPRAGDHARAASKTGARMVCARCGSDDIDYSGPYQDKCFQCGSTEQKPEGLCDLCGKAPAVHFGPQGYTCAECSKGVTIWASKDQPFRPVYDDALFADAPITLIAADGGLTSTAAAEVMDFGGRLKALVNGVVQDIFHITDRDAVTGSGAMVPLHQVLYPTYSPTRGLTLTVTADLHDEPEPALPSTEGDDVEHEAIEHDHDEAIAIEAFADPAVAPEMAEVVTASLAESPPKPGDPRLEWLMTGAAAAPAAGDFDVAAGAKAYLAKQALKSFSPEEQKAIIEEGLDVQAANLGDLDLEGTHYLGLEAAFRQEEGEDEL